MRIELISSRELLTAVNRIMFLEIVVENLDKEDYPYGDSLDTAVAIKDILQEVQKAEKVAIRAADGLEKNEEYDIFSSAMIKITGEDVPLFISPDLPRGMRVKEMLWFVVSDTAFIWVGHAIEQLASMDIDGNVGVPLGGRLE